MEESLKQMTEMMSKAEQRLRKNWPKSFRELPEIQSIDDWETFGRQLYTVNIMLMA